MYSSTVVLIPARNEAASVGAVILELLEYQGISVVLIDDASTDDTAVVARNSGAIVLQLSVRLGAWGATQAGMRYALKNGYQYFVTMDADGQHSAGFVGELASPVLRGKGDVCIGSCVGRGSKARKVAWYLLKRFSGLSMEDITSGFRVYNRAAVNVLAGREATLLEYQDIGVLALLRSEGMRLLDIPVKMRPRTTGHSRVFSSWLAVAYYMAYSLILGVSKR